MFFVITLIFIIITFHETSTLQSIQLKVIKPEINLKKNFGQKSLSSIKYEPLKNIKNVILTKF